MCNDSAMSRDKIKHALEWQIPAVNPDWLWDSIRNREVQNLKSYLLYPAAQQHLQLALPVDADLVDKDPAFADLKDLNEQKEKQGSDENAAQPRPDPEVNDDSEHKTQVAPFVEDEEPIYLPTVEDESKKPASKEEEILEPSKILDKPLLQPIPLQERSPNSPTKPKSQPTNPHEEKSLAQRQAADRAILSDTLQTILSRQKSSGSAENLRRTASSGSARGTSTRREKRLLGRATSNLSVRSGNGAIVLGLNTNLSRASSIDTLHTDGLGTPIEGLPSAPLFAPSRMNSKEEQTSLTASALTSHDELLAADDDEHDQGHQHLQMTQVGYEDPEAGRWRAKFLKKITASKANKNPLDVEDDTAADTGPIESASRGGLLEDEPHVAGSSRRTRRR